MFIAYLGQDEAIITTPEYEQAVIQEWFVEGQRDATEYNRMVIMEPAVQVKSRQLG